MKEYCDKTYFTHYVLKYYGYGHVSGEEDEILTYIKIYHSLPSGMTEAEEEEFIERCGYMSFDRQKQYAMYKNGKAADDYEYKIAKRIAENLGGDLKVNRCVKCQSILRTNKARWCEWCGYYRKSIFQIFFGWFSKYTKSLYRRMMF